MFSINRILHIFYFISTLLYIISWLTHFGFNESASLGNSKKVYVSIRQSLSVRIWHLGVNTCYHHNQMLSFKITGINSRSRYMKTFVANLTLAEIDPCDGNFCQNGATCTSAGLSYSCQCDVGYSGPLCDTGKNSCHNLHFSVRSYQLVRK